MSIADFEASTACDAAEMDDFDAKVTFEAGEKVLMREIVVLENRIDGEIYLIEDARREKDRRLYLQHKKICDDLESKKRECMVSLYAIFAMRFIGNTSDTLWNWCKLYGKLRLEVMNDMAKEDYTV